MKTMIRTVGSGMLFGILLTSATTSALALGFRNPDQDAAATAQGEAFVAQADNASAIYYNPAGLTQIKGTTSRGGAYVTFRDIQFNGTAANESFTQPAYTLNQYLSSDLGTEKFRVGLGFNLPFGNGIDWEQNTSFKYQLTKSSLRVFGISGAVAYEFNEHLSLGAVLNFYDGYTELEQLVPFSKNPLFPPGTKDSVFRFAGSGQTFGGTLGLMYHFNDRNTVGLTYRSPFGIDFNGYAVVPDAPAFLGGIYRQSFASAHIDFPQSIAVGYAFRPKPNLKIEADIEWTDWEHLNTVPLHSPSPAFAKTPPIQFNWQNGFYYELGAEYKLDDQWKLRAGYIYSENTVPDSTFSPSLPDSNRHVFSVGGGFTAKRMTVDLTYQYSLSNDRTVTGSPMDALGNRPSDGQWKSQGHAVMVSSTLRF